MDRVLAQAGRGGRPRGAPRTDIDVRDLPEPDERHRFDENEPERNARLREMIGDTFDVGGRGAKMAGEMVAGSPKAAAMTAAFTNPVTAPAATAALAAEGAWTLGKGAAQRVFGAPSIDTRDERGRPMSPSDPRVAERARVAEEETVRGGDMAGAALQVGFLPFGAKPLAAQINKGGDAVDRVLALHAKSRATDFALEKRFAGAVDRQGREKVALPLLAKEKEAAELAAAQRASRQREPKLLTSGPDYETPVMREKEAAELASAQRDSRLREPKMLMPGRPAVEPMEEDAAGVVDRVLRRFDEGGTARRPRPEPPDGAATTADVEAYARARDEGRPLAASGRSRRIAQDGDEYESVVERLAMRDEATAPAETGSDLFTARAEGRTLAVDAKGRLRSDSQLDTLEVDELSDELHRRLSKRAEREQLIAHRDDPKWASVSELGNTVESTGWRQVTDDELVGNGGKPPKGARKKVDNAGVTRWYKQNEDLPTGDGAYDADELAALRAQESEYARGTMTSQAEDKAIARIEAAIERKRNPRGAADPDLILPGGGAVAGGVGGGLTIDSDDTTGERVAKVVGGAAGGAGLGAITSRVLGRAPSIRGGVARAGARGGYVGDPTELIGTRPFPRRISPEEMERLAATERKVAGAKAGPIRIPEKSGTMSPVLRAEEEAAATGIDGQLAKLKARVAAGEEPRISASAPSKDIDLADVGHSEWWNNLSKKEREAALKDVGEHPSWAKNDIDGAMPDEHWVPGFPRAIKKAHAKWQEGVRALPDAGIIRGNRTGAVGDLGERGSGSPMAKTNRPAVEHAGRKAEISEVAPNEEGVTHTVRAPDGNVMRYDSRELAEAKAAEWQSGFGSRLRSRTATAINDAPFEKGTAEQWKAALTKNVPASERDWVGLDEYLDGNAGKVLTRDQVAEKFNAGRIQIGEVVRDDADKALGVARNRAAEEHNRKLDALRAAVRVQLPHANAGHVHSFDEALRLADTVEGAAETAGVELTPNLKRAANAYLKANTALREAETAARTSASTGRSTQFGEYVEPGGGDYEEIVLTLPRKATTEAPSIKSVEEALQSLREDGIANPEEAFGYTNREDYITAAIRRRGDRPSLRLDEAKSLYYRDKPGGAWDNESEAVRDVYKNKAAGVADGEQSFTSSHFPGIDNPIAHVRLRKNVKLPNGEKAVFVEEIQSDWHQKGRKVGYAQPKAETDALYAERNALNARIADPVSPPTPEELDRLENLNHELSNRTGTVPDAPLKKTTEWATLGLMRAVDEAVATGADRVIWTTGEQQARRYDLSKVADRVHYDPKSGDLDVWMGDEIVHNGRYDAKALPDVIGKEATSRLLATSVEPRDLSKISADVDGFTAEALHELSGEQLRVGGEGMKAFYDKMLPSAVKDYAKKMGVKLEVEPVQATPHSRVDQHAAREIADDYRNGSGGRETVTDRHEEIATLLEQVADELEHAPGSNWRKYLDQQASDYPKGIVTEARRALESAEETSALTPGAPEAPQNMSFKITPELKAKIKKDGQPMAAIIGAATGASMAGASEAEAQDEDGGGSVMPTLLLALAGGVAGALGVKALRKGARGKAAGPATPLMDAAVKRNAAARGEGAAARAAKKAERIKEPTAPYPKNIDPTAAARTAAKPPKADDVLGDIRKRYTADPGIEKEIRESTEQLIKEGKVPAKIVVTHAEEREIADSLGLDAAQLATKDPSRKMSGAELLALRDYVNTLAARKVELRKIAGSATSTEAQKESAAELLSVLNRKTEQVVTRISRDRSQSGRDLNTLKMMAKRSDDPHEWVLEAEEMLGGNRKLTDLEKAEFEGALEARDFAKATRALAKFRQSTPAEKFSTLYRAGLLSALSRPIRDIISNVANVMVRGQAEQFVATQADKLASIFTGVRTTDYGTEAAKAALAGAKRGAKESVAIMGESFPFLKKYGTADPAALEAAMQRHDFLRETQFDNPILDWSTKLIQRSLGAADAFMFRAAEAGAKQSYAQAIAKTRAVAQKIPAAERASFIEKETARLLKDPSDEMRVRALESASESVWQNRTTLGQVGAGIQKIPVAGPMILPFSRTPGAMAMDVVRSTPLGLIEAVPDVMNLLRKQKVPQAQAALVKKLGKVSVGSALMYAGYLLGDERGATAWYPDNAAERNEWKQSGKIENAIRHDGKWVALPVLLGPAGMLMSIGVYMRKLMEEEGKSFAAAGARASTEGTVKALLSAPMLQAPAAIVETLRRGDEAPEQLASAFAGSFVPQIVQRIARGMDTNEEGDQVIRDARGEDFTESVMNAVKAGIPGARSTLPAKVSSTGRVRTGSGGGVMSNVNPVRTSKDVTADDPVTKEMERLGRGIGERQRLKGESRGAFGDRGGAEGSELKDVLGRLIASPDYNQWPPEPDGWVVRATEHNKVWTDESDRRAPQDKMKDALLDYMQDFVRTEQTKRRKANQGATP